VRGAHRHEHHRDDQQGGERRGQPEREEDASRELTRARRERERAAWAQAKRSEEPAEALEPGTTEGPKQLLRAVGRDEGADHDMYQQKSNFHLTLPFSLLQPGRYSLTFRASLP
jgi:hypothetical protein